MSQEGSSIAAMIKRFREEKPTSRAEREHQRKSGGLNPLWWEKENANDSSNSNSNGNSNSVENARKSNNTNSKSNNINSKSNNINSKSNNINSKNNGSSIEGIDRKYPTKYDPLEESDTSNGREEIEVRRQLPRPTSQTATHNQVLQSLNKGTDFMSSYNSNYGNNYDSSLPLKKNTFLGTATSVDDLIEKEIRQLSEEVKQREKGITDRMNRLDRSIEGGLDRSLDSSISFKPTFRFGNKETNRNHKAEPFSDTLSLLRSSNRQEQFLASSIDTLGSTGFRGLLLPELRLNAERLEQQEEEKVKPLDGDVNELNSNLEELLKSLNANREAEGIASYLPEDVKETLRQIENKAHNDLMDYLALKGGEYIPGVGPKIPLMEEKVHEKEAEGDEASPPLDLPVLKTPLDKLDQMIVAAKLDDGFIADSAVKPSVATGAGVPRAAGRSTILNFDANVGLIQTAVDAEMTAAESVFNQMRQLRQGLAGRMRQLDSMTRSEAPGPATENESERRNYSRHWDRQWGFNSSNNGNVNNHNVYSTAIPDYEDKPYNWNPFPELVHTNILGTAKGISAVLDSAMSTLNYRLPPGREIVLEDSIYKPVKYTDHPRSFLGNDGDRMKELLNLDPSSLNSNLGDYPALSSTSIDGINGNSNSENAIDDLHASTSVAAELLAKLAAAAAGITEQPTDDFNEEEEELHVLSDNGTRSTANVPTREPHVYKYPEGKIVAIKGIDESKNETFEAVRNGLANISSNPSAAPSKPILKNASDGTSNIVSQKRVEFVPSAKELTTTQTKMGSINRDYVNSRMDEIDFMLKDDSRVSMRNGNGDLDMFVPKGFHSRFLENSRQTNPENLDYLAEISQSNSNLPLPWDRRLPGNKARFPVSSVVRQPKSPTIVYGNGNNRSVGSMKSLALSVAPTAPPIHSPGFEKAATEIVDRSRSCNGNTFTSPTSVQDVPSYNPHYKDMPINSLNYSLYGSNNTNDPRSFDSNPIPVSQTSDYVRYAQHYPLRRPVEGTAINYNRSIEERSQLQTKILNTFDYSNRSESFHIASPLSTNSSVGEKENYLKEMRKLRQNMGSMLR